MKEKLLKSLKDSIVLNPTERVWQMPFFGAFGVGIVLSISAFYERIDLGLISMIGVLAFLYVPNTPIYHRMAVVMSCSFGLCLCFLLGLLTHILPSFLTPFIIAFIAATSSILVRYYDIGAPGYFFFVFSALLASFFPFELSEFIFLTGLVCVGTMVANLMAFLYSLSVIYIFKNSLPKPVPLRGELGFEVVVVDSLIMGVFIGFALFVGNFLELERSYWVAVSCAVVMQGISLNGVFIKQLQRILGTFFGVLLAWYLLSINFSTLSFILLMMFLFFMTEFVVTRNYALAMIFITPYTTYLAEVASKMSLDAEVIASARLIDIVLGSILGLIGGFVMHKHYLRKYFDILARAVFRIKRV